MPATTTATATMATLPVRSVEALRPLHWLRAGLADMRAMPVASLAYGILFALMGFTLTRLGAQQPHLVSASVSGFFLIGPFLGIGLYRLSQAREAGEPINMLDSLTAWRRNSWSIGLFGVMLAFVLLSWERISAILFALFHGTGVPVSDGGWAERLVAVADPGFLLIYGLLGGGLALAVFAISVVALPLLLAGPHDPVTAAVTSLHAVRRNGAAMAVWAVLIVTLIGLGMAMAFVGLIVTMPLVAHATWHAFRDLIETD